jgi:hypothetical protein
MEAEDVMKYHQYVYSRNAIVVILEVSEYQYVWLSFFLAKRLRNKAISCHIIQHLIAKLKGTHHIHWLSDITTFRELAKKLAWNHHGESPFFADCQACSTESKGRKGFELSPLFDLVLRHTVSKSPPELPTIRSKDVRKIIEAIKNHFEV